MKFLKCSVDGCDRDAHLDIWPDDDTREWLCEHHAEQAHKSDWITFPVKGRTLMNDMCSGWFYLPERDENLAALARNMEIGS